MLAALVFPTGGKKPDALHRRDQAWKYGAYREKIYFVKSLDQNYYTVLLKVFKETKFTDKP